MDSVVEMRNVSRSYRSGGETNKVLDDLSITIKKREMVMIMGPSGSGKTTLLNILGGIDQADGGSVMVAGADLTGLDVSSLNKYRRSKVGFIFQFYNLIPTLTAAENIELSLETHMKKRARMRSRAREYLELVGLRDKIDAFPQEMSGGQQQRVAVARALAKEPDLILADEPTGNLDEARERSVMELMNMLQHKIGTTILIVSHNSALKRYMDRTLILRRGKLESDRTNGGH
ncbi:MAG: ATP-binding cassette domain-containing protein [Chitinivibrionales bacterium]|nr:ATP-binding cassette domain-containing protein [Chitinivibrionales bacterium]MBD3355991.1 ATP-binding cassette domain-containing protein [Chitinivibrionales bacterium]